MTEKQQKELGAMLHQMCNYSAFFAFYCRMWHNSTNHKQINYLLKQGENSMNSMVDKISIVIGEPELRKLAQEQIGDENRLADLMAIMEYCSGLDNESLEKVRDIVESVFKPIVDERKV